MARGAWRDPRLGEQPLGEWFRGWIATRTDIAESTRMLYRQVLDSWIDAQVPRSLRRPEGRGLQRKHVDLDAGVVRVEQSLAARRTGQGWFSAPKTRAGKRSVVLPGVAVDALRDHMEEFTPPGGDALIFGTSTGTPLPSSHRSTMFAKARATSRTALPARR